MRLIAIAALSALLICGSAVAQPLNLLAFQGLDGRSTRADALKLFPTVARENQCSKGQASSRSAEGETACETFVVDAYKVDNTEFKLTFIFTIEGQLRYVSLLHHYGSPHRDLPGVKREEIAIRYRSLADLLSTRYGPAVVDSSGLSLALASTVGELEWQPGRGSKWIAGGDRVKLFADAIEKRSEPGAYWGTVHIFYTFGRRSEADRL